MQIVTDMKAKFIIKYWKSIVQKVIKAPLDDLENLSASAFQVEEGAEGAAQAQTQEGAAQAQAQQEGAAQEE